MLNDEDARSWTSHRQFPLSRRLRCACSGIDVIPLISTGLPPRSPTRTSRLSNVLEQLLPNHPGQFKRSKAPNGSWGQTRSGYARLLSEKSPRKSCLGRQGLGVVDATKSCHSRSNSASNSGPRSHDPDQRNSDASAVRQTSWHLRTRTRWDAPHGTIQKQWVS
ncbi:hypothetical protein BKA81DRAFT_75584 [Phyllosticta paracitricarpa]